MEDREMGTSSVAVVGSPVAYRLWRRDLGMVTANLAALLRLRPVPLPPLPSSGVLDTMNEFSRV